MFFLRIRSVKISLLFFQGIRSVKISCRSLWNQFWTTQKSPKLWSCVAKNKQMIRPQKSSIKLFPKFYYLIILQKYHPIFSMPATAIKRVDFKHSILLNIRWFFLRQGMQHKLDTSSDYLKNARPFKLDNCVFFFFQPLKKKLTTTCLLPTYSCCLFCGLKLEFGININGETIW